MEKKIVELCGLGIRLLLRYWTRNEKTLGNNLLDVEAFARKCGLGAIESSRFKVSIDMFALEMAEDFIKNVSTSISELERKEEIISQFKTDIEKISLSEVKILEENLNAEDLSRSIMNLSTKERQLWSEKENGVYVNCVRYVSKCILDFVKELPSYAPEALNVIIQRQDEYAETLHKVLDECHAIRDVLKRVDITYREFEEAYREEIIKRYGKVELLGAGIMERAIRKYDISSAYVELECVDEDYEEDIELSKVFSKKKVVWIKGEAGSGKTTFLQWVAICSAKNDYEEVENIRNTIPIVISLRNAEWPLNLQGTIRKFSSNLGYTCPDGWLDNALKEKRVIVLIDGLDEVEESKRDETYDFIEELVECNSGIKVLITARNSVDDTMTCDVLHCELQPMRISNIKKFVNYWHRAVLRTDAIEDDDKISKLQKELVQKIVRTPSIKALAKNPLLCAMICALNYVNDEYLPENKMELYSKCCEMLIDARDNQRKIVSSGYEELTSLDYSKKYRILEALAYWMLKNENVSKNKIDVIDFIDKLLKNINILPEGSKCDAKRVLEYLVERSGIIREVEKGCIDFVHKTFMEFMAAKAICRECDFENLVREACNVNWKETIVMCFSEMNERQVGSVLELMVEKGKEKNDERYILMAALGSANTIYKNLRIKEEIDKQISQLIPPKKKNISELAKAGLYLLPFLFDDENYSNAERLKCLELLEYLELEKPILNIISYLRGKGSMEIKQKVGDILSCYSEEVLEEYNVRTQLVDIVLESIQDNSLMIPENILNVIGEYQFTKSEKERALGVKRLYVYGSDWDDSIYTNRIDAYKYFKGVNELVLMDWSTGLECTRYLANLERLNITSIAIDIEKLAEIDSLKKIKYLRLDLKILNYFCERDICRMKHLEKLEFFCLDRNLEFAFESWESFKDLKEIVIKVHEDVLEDITRNGALRAARVRGVNIVYKGYLE